VFAPGEVVQIDSTPQDVLVRLDDGVVRKIELTGMIDVATRTVTAAVLRPTTKAVDASVLLARTVTPELMQPGWADALRMSRSVLPYRRLLDIDERLEHAAAKPVIVPEMIVCDHGKAFISRNFKASCHFLEIDFQPTHKASPFQKGHVEKMLDSVGTLFAQFVAGYTGRSTDHRGRNLDKQPLWSLPELQELLDEWLVATWQNREHDGLRDPLHPGRSFTPNEKYAALVETCGYVPVALSAEDYIDLLPSIWRAVNDYGIRIKRRTYDGPGLIRRQHSGVTEKKGLWEVHHDPYDISRIWVRDHHGDGEWIEATWKHLRHTPVPFGELAWDHAARGLPEGTSSGHRLSPCFVPSLPVASWSSSAESFPCTSITVRALPSSPSSRATFASSRAISLSLGSAFGRPAGAARAALAPLSRCCRQTVISDEYRPSRRSRAPLPCLSSVSYSARILALYSAEYRRGPDDRGITCGSGVPGSLVLSTSGHSSFSALD
jgi:hypothetical protein